MDGGAWWASVYRVMKSWTRLSNFTFHFHALEKEMATHSSVLAWRIPGMGDPMDCSIPGFPVLHQLLEHAQTRVHRVGDAIQPSHPLSSSSPPAFNLDRKSVV